MKFMPVCIDVCQLHSVKDFPWTIHSYSDGPEISSSSINSLVSSNLDVHLRLHKTSLLNPILSQLSPFYPCTWYLSKLQLICIFPSTIIWREVVFSS